MAVTGANGLAEAQRRFGKRCRSAAATDQHDFSVEELMNPGRRGAAHAAARQGNDSARRALAELKSATDALARGDDGGAS
jgi:hypothetical protein